MRPLQTSQLISRIRSGDRLRMRHIALHRAASAPRASPPFPSPFPSVSLRSPDLERFLQLRRRRLRRHLALEGELLEGRHRGRNRARKRRNEENPRRGTRCRARPRPLAALSPAFSSTFPPQSREILKSAQRLCDFPAKTISMWPLSMSAILKHEKSRFRILSLGRRPRFY